MTRLAAPSFTDRLVPRFPAAHSSQACAEPVAPAENTSPAGAAFLHFTESSFALRASEDMSSSCVGARETDARPAVGRTFELSEHTMILLRAIAAYERCSNARAVDLALADYVTKIGAGPLARAVLDERERLALRGPQGVADDLHDLPHFVRRDERRFSRAREAHRDSSVSQGTRR